MSAKPPSPEKQPAPQSRTGASQKREPRRSRDELDVLIRARYPILYVVTWEEGRVVRRLAQIAKARDKRVFTWSCTQGIVQYGAEPQANKASRGTVEPMAALDAVIGDVEPAIYIFKDFHHFMVPPPDGAQCNVPVVRRLREVAHRLRDTYKTLIIVSPLLRLAPELEKDVTVVEFGLPTVKDFHRLLDNIIEDVKGNPNLKIDLTAEGRERLLHAAKGLTLREAENVFAKTLVLDGRLNADDVDVVFSEKQQIIKKGGLLEYCEPETELGQVGGLESLKSWLTKRSLAFSERAAEFGLPAPKGVLAYWRSGLWQKPLCQSGIESVAVASAALRHGQDVRQPRRFERGERAPCHRDS